MTKTLAIARRILLQFAHDKRTLALLFIAPIVVLWLLSVLFGAGAYEPRLATVGLDPRIQSALEEEDTRITDTSRTAAEELLAQNEVDAVLYMQDEETLVIWAEGTDSAKTAAAASAVSSAVGTVRKDASEQMEADVEQKKDEIAQRQEEAQATQEEMRSAVESVLLTLPAESRASLPKELAEFMEADSDDVGAMLDDFTLDITDYMPVQEIEVTYFHGNEDWKMFDFYGPVFIGVFLFIFVFLTSGMSLVNEKSAGTMSRFLATPVTSPQILGGYVIGFGVLAIIQSAIILFISLTFIGFPNVGNPALVMFIVMSLALVSVTIGLLVSGLASSAFQVIQLMILFIVPQILLSGLFELSGTPEWLQVLSRCFPLTYGVDALRDVMLRGADLADIGLEITVIWGFVVLFFALAALKFRKKRAQGRV